MSQKRPWNTALSSLVITLCDDPELASSTIIEISKHPSITVQTNVGTYLPIAIESTDARVIHEWLEDLPGVTYVDVVFCSTELPNEEPLTLASNDAN